MNYYERHIGDYLKDTSHLSLLEHGIYTRLIDVYYTRETPIPVADAARLIGARSKDERESLQSVLSEFFKLESGAYVQQRCDKEIIKFADKSGKAKRSAMARWDALRLQSESNAKAMRTHSDGSALAMLPIPNPQSPNTSTPIPPSGFAVGFEEFWKAYPKKIGKDAAAKAFAKRKPNRELLAAMVVAVEAHKRTDQWKKDGGQFIPNPATWLNEGRWQDGLGFEKGPDDWTAGAV